MGSLEGQSIRSVVVDDDKAIGEILKERMDELGIECVLRYREDFSDESNEEKIRERCFEEQVQFLKRHLLST